MANNYLNLSTDTTLGGENASDYEVSSQKAIKDYVDSHSSSDPNEIPDGTIIEGNFSDLQDFFDTLEGKFCKGSVTYKITQDETVTEAIITKIPKWNIAEVIIDGNEKTITGSNLGTDVKVITFYSGNYNGIDDTLGKSYNINQLIKIQNINITNDGGAFQVTRSLGKQVEFCIGSCSFTSKVSSNNGAAVTCNGGRIQVEYCEFTDTGNKTYTNGIRCFHGASLFSTYNIYTNYSWGVWVSHAGFVQSFGDTFTNCSNCDGT